MADTRVKPAARGIGASSASAYVAQRGTIDGTAYTADWLARLSAEGRMLTFNVGTRSTPITGGGVYVATTPDLDVRIPAGTLVVPTRLEVVYETVGTSGIQECFALAGAGGTYATSAVPIVPTNHRTDLGDTHGLLAQGPATGAVIPTVNTTEFFRNSPPMGITKTSQSATVTSIDPYRMEWSALASGMWLHVYTVAESFAQIMVWAGGQAPTVFISLTVVVPPITE